MYHKLCGVFNKFIICKISLIPCRCCRYILKPTAKLGIIVGVGSNKPDGAGCNFQWEAAKARCRSFVSLFQPSNVWIVK